MKKTIKKNLKIHIRAGDRVKILAGKHRNEQGTVVKVFPKAYRAIVEGMNIVVRHVKPSAERPTGAIQKQPSPIHISNLMLIDPISGVPTRVGRKHNASGKLQRYAKKQEILYKMLKPRLQEKYFAEVIPSLKELFGYKSPMQVPRLQKICINQGLGDGVSNKKLIQLGLEELTAITGQCAVPTRAKKSVSNFKLRVGMPIGVKVTLRGRLMYEFLDRFISIALPRIRNFWGLRTTGFDGNGNYNVGIQEQIIFPEISIDKVIKINGMNITFVTTAQDNEAAFQLLKALGMPFNVEQD